MCERAQIEDTLDMKLYGFRWSQLYDGWKCNDDFTTYIRSSHENSFIVEMESYSFDDSIIIYKVDQNGDHIDYFLTLNSAIQYCDDIINDDNKDKEVPGCTTLMNIK